VTGDGGHGFGAVDKRARAMAEEKAEDEVDVIMVKESRHVIKIRHHGGFGAVSIIAEGVLVLARGGGATNFIIVGPKAAMEDKAGDSRGKGVTLPAGNCPPARRR
jgi:hypothetical protein